MSIPENSLCSCYGLSDLSNLVINSTEYDDVYMRNPDNACLDIFSKQTTVLLFVSLAVDKTSEKYQPLSDLLLKRYGVYGNCISERQFKDSSKKIRVGVFRINDDPESKLLKLLYTMSNHAFIVVIRNEEHDFYLSEFIECVLTALQQGILLPQILSQCCKETIKRGFSFLHILRGFDGFSINCLKESKET